MTDPMNKTSPRECVLTNARLCLPDQIVEGTVSVVDGKIHAVDTGRSGLPQAVDLAGDFLMPGIVELHTDNLEKHLIPRKMVRWPSTLAAFLTHDLQMLGAGVTTAFVSICVGEYAHNKHMRRELLHRSIETLRRVHALDAARGEHLLHLRCEAPDPEMWNLLEPYLDEPLLRFLSVMNHTMGQGQFADPARFRAYYDNGTWTEEYFERLKIETRENNERFAEPQRRQVVEACAARNIPVASHDDATLADVERAAADGVAVSEFPTTLEAARHAHAKGVRVMMGSPNIILGGSHSGNVAAMEVAKVGCLDILSSDYAPQSLLPSAFQIHRETGAPLHETLAALTLNPADAVNLPDHGRLAPGARADLLRVSLYDDEPHVHDVWVGGVKVLGR